MIFLFKQQTAYEMRISDWSSDVCSSDLEIPDHGCARSRQWPDEGLLRSVGDSQSHADRRPSAQHRHCRHLRATDKDRTSVVQGKSVSERVDLGGRCIIKIKYNI